MDEKLDREWLLQMEQIEERDAEILRQITEEVKEHERSIKSILESDEAKAQDELIKRILEENAEQLRAVLAKLEPGGLAEDR